MTEPCSGPLPGELRPIAVDADRWSHALPADSWPAAFPESGAVWRSDVFAVASQWRAGEGTARQLTAAVLMWGYGPTGYGPWRTNQVLTADPTGQKLNERLELLRHERVSLEDLAKTYERFLKRPRLPYLGPAFFTKLIYFAGYRRSVGGIQPLILDSVVARRLPSDIGVDSSRWLWPAEQWLAYLTWASRQGFNEADQAEMALFNGVVV